MIHPIIPSQTRSGVAKRVTLGFTTLEREDALKIWNRREMPDNAMIARMAIVYNKKLLEPTTNINDAMTAAVAVLLGKQP